MKDVLGLARDVKPAARVAASKTEFKDPESANISEWNWRPLEDVKGDLGLSEIPSHVNAFGDFMDRTAERASREGLTPRDLIKAYTITRASIQRRATPAENLRKVGMVLPDNVTGPVRPEGAFGHWLHSPAGQAYLNYAERGQVNEQSISDAVKRMAPFGRHETDIPDALRWAAQNLPDKAQQVSELVAAAREKASSPDEWRDFVKNVRGIGPSKAGFVASLMGRGDQPTLDARQIILHTGRPSKEAAPFIARKGGEGGAEAVNRLAARQEAMNLSIPEKLEPYYQHLAHHAVWDKAGNEETTHEDVINAMQHAARGGAIHDHPVMQVMKLIHPEAFPEGFKKGGRAKQMLTWDQIPTINPQDLVGKRVFPIFADLTKAGSPYEGIDSSKLLNPEQMFGGPGYPLLPESLKHGLAWAVEGKGRGSAKIRKDADYVIVHAMEQTSHQSNASFANSLMKTMKQYVTDNRFNPEVVQQIDDMIRRPTEQKELQSLKNFPGFAHKNAENFLRNLSFEARLRVARVLESAEAQALGAPNIDKITRATLDPQFAGVPSRAGLFVMEIPKGTEEEQLVHLKSAGLPEHPSYQYGIKGRIVGKFHHPVAPEVLYSDWFDQKKAEQKEGKTNIRRAFDLAMPTVTISQDVADRLPHRPQDIQSAKAAQMSLNAFNDKWHDTDTPVNQGGLGAAQLSQALKNSDSSSTLSLYSPQEINQMKKDGKFTGYKLKDGEVYFGLKRGTNYKDEYGFDHPDLTDNETALTSVVNNETGAKGIGGAPVVLKAIQHGATALDAYAVPTDKHPDGFLPDFYSHFGFEELGRVPFDPKYVTPQQFNDMKHEWKKTGWDEKKHGLPSLAIMKWRGSDDDRQDAVRRYITKGGEGFGPRYDPADVEAAALAPEQGAGQGIGEEGISGSGDASGNRGTVRANNAPRPSDRFTRTLSAIKGLSPQEAQHFGLNPEDIEQAKASGLAEGGSVDRKKNLADFQAGNDPIVPHVMYHGTKYGNIGKFEGWRESAGHFAFTPEVASDFAKGHDTLPHEDTYFYKEGPQVYPVHISAKAVFDPRKEKHVRMIGDHPGKMWDWQDLENAIPAIKKAGFDSYLDFEHGIQGFGEKPEPSGIAVFHPHQIKSATGNNGNFDPNDPDITKGEGGSVDNQEKYGHIIAATKGDAFNQQTHYFMNTHSGLKKIQPAGSAGGTDLYQEHDDKSSHDPEEIKNEYHSFSLVHPDVKIGEKIKTPIQALALPEGANLRLASGATMTKTKNNKFNYPDDEKDYEYFHFATGNHAPVWEGNEKKEDDHYSSEHFQDGGEVEPPQRSVKAYKLFRTDPRAPGQIFPLFVDANKPVPMGKWVKAEAGPAGKDPTKVKSKLGDLAYRPGWHAGDLPVATHIGAKSDPSLKAPDIRPDNHVWAEVEMPDDVDWQSIANSRARITKAGTPDLKTAHITDQVPYGGHYRYKTNPNMTGNWLIGGEMKVNRLLDDDEVKEINDANGVADLPRMSKAYGGRAHFGFGGDAVGAGSGPVRGGSGSVAAARAEAPAQRETLNAFAGRGGGDTEGNQAPRGYRDMPPDLLQAHLDLNARGREATEAMQRANESRMPFGFIGRGAPSAYDIANKEHMPEWAIGPAPAMTTFGDQSIVPGGVFGGGAKKPAPAPHYEPTLLQNQIPAATPPLPTPRPAPMPAPRPTQNVPMPTPRPADLQPSFIDNFGSAVQDILSIPQKIVSGIGDAFTQPQQQTMQQPQDRGGGRRRLVKKLMPDGSYQDVWEEYADGGVAKYRSYHHNPAIIEHALGKVAAPPPAFNQTLKVAKRGRPL